MAVNCIYYQTIPVSPFTSDELTLLRIRIFN
jgi:hypothetical protein